METSPLCSCLSTTVVYAGHAVALHRPAGKALIGFSPSLRITSRVQPCSGNAPRNSCLALRVQGGVTRTEPGSLASTASTLPTGMLLTYHAEEQHRPKTMG